MTVQTNRKTVGIGCVCVGNESSEFTAYAVGSCIALCLVDPSAKIGAMAHILLPSRRYQGRNEFAQNDTRYADKALAAALAEMKQAGADSSHTVAAVIGGAEMFPHGDTEILNIGRMNTESVISELSGMHIPILYTATGGNRARTVTFRIHGTGFDDRLTVRTSGVITGR